MISIFKKELRDLLPWMAASLVVMAAVCLYGLIREDIASIFTIACAIVALGFGLLQSVGDLRTEAKGYLLHRPISIGRIFWGKLLSGFLAYAICILLPLLAMAIYRESVGPARTLSAWDLVPTLLMSIVAFSFYPAAIWMMSRPAKWLGTKTIPLGGAALGCLLSLSMLDGYSPPEYRFLFWLGFGAFTIVTLVLCIMAAAEAFCHRQFLPSLGYEGHRFSANNLGILTMCTTGAAVVGVTVLATVFPTSIYPVTSHQIAMTADGQLWDFATTHRSQETYRNPEISVAKLSANDEVPLSNFTPPPANWDERRTATLHGRVRIHGPIWTPDFKYFSQFQVSNSDQLTVYEHRNRLLAYSQNSGRLVTVVTPEGCFDSIDEAKGSFEFVYRFLSLGGYANSFKQQSPSIGETLIFDRNGLYQINWKGRNIRTILDQPIDSVALVLPASDQEAVLWARHGTTISRHAVKPKDPEMSLELIDSEIVARSLQYRLPDITLAKTAEWSFPGTPGKPSLIEEQKISIAVSETDDKTLFCKIPNYYNKTGHYQFRATDGAIQDEADFGFASQTRNRDDSYLLSLLPPSIGLSLAAFAPKEAGISIMPLAIYLAVHALIAMAAAFWLARAYELPASSRNWWLLAAAILGIGTPLAIWMCYPKLIREQCPHCNASRRIDRSRCRQCGADWTKPAREGNEIIGAAKHQHYLPSGVNG